MQSNGYIIWLTGLSGSGKSTLSSALSIELTKKGYDTEVLDGDSVRHELCKDLGFSKEDRDENIRRIGYVARVLERHGVIVIVAAISPYRTIRNEVRFKSKKFVEVYVNAPIKVCESRDPKNLYKRFRMGEIRNVTGIDDPYEPPIHPDIECRTDLYDVNTCVEKIIDVLKLYQK